MARHDTADVVYGDFAAAAGCLIIIEILAQVVAFDLRVRFGEGFGHVAQACFCNIRWFWASSLRLLSR